MFVTTGKVCQIIESWVEFEIDVVGGKVRAVRRVPQDYLRDVIGPLPRAQAGDAAGNAGFEVAVARWKAEIAPILIMGLYDRIHVPADDARFHCREGHVIADELQRKDSARWTR